MTDDLVIEAFHKAMKSRKINKNGIFHSDRGSQYTSNNYEKLLEGLKIKHLIVKKVILMIMQVLKLKCHIKKRRSKC